MKQFEVPVFYRSSLISSIKKSRKEADRMKKDFTATLLDFGPVQIYLARHFGFCYGVENAIEIAFKTIEENPGKKIYLLSEIIHNPQVNKDLTNLGVRFLQDNYGNQLVPYENISKEDIVLIPAFGTTLSIEKKLRDIGISIDRFNTTCPFVEKVWNRSAAIAAKNYTIVIHGKPTHEETRATFSHAKDKAPAVVVKDMQQAIALSKYIVKEKPGAEFYTEFKGQYSEGFDVEKDLDRIGVVNQTTMLASDTQDIADFLKTIIQKKYFLDDANVNDRFADTKDTLCYATNDNQSAIYGMLNINADLAIVVGGYNSSNTSHLVELCEEKLPTYFINNAEKLISKNEISHFNLNTKTEQITSKYLPEQKPVKVLMSSGASCPDKIVEQVIEKLVSFYPNAKSIEQIIAEF